MKKILLGALLYLIWIGLGCMLMKPAVAQVVQGVDTFPMANGTRTTNWVLAADEICIASKGAGSYSGFGAGTRTNGNPTITFQCFKTSWFTGYSVIGRLDCPAGHVPNGVDTQCIPSASVCQAGLVREVLLSAGTRTVSGGTTDMAAPTNVQGCQTGLVELLGCFSATTSPAVGDAIKCRWRYIQTGVSLGTSAGGGQPATEDTPKQQPSVPPFNPAQGQGCPKGTVSMGTDSAGQSICGGSGSAPAVPAPPPSTEKPTTSVTNPDGSVTATKVTERLNADGSKTTVTETTVTGTDGTKTSTKDTVTGKTAAGLTGKADDTEADKDKNFCKQHPELNICKNSQVTGACESLACTGDAIQCAIAKQVAEQNCRGQKDFDAAKVSPQYVLANQAISGADPLQGTFPNPKAGTVYGMPSTLDGQGWLGTRSCFSDKTFVVQGRMVTMPFSKLCDYLIVFRGVMMIIAALVCFKMLSGTILRE